MKYCKVKVAAVQYKHFAESLLDFYAEEVKAKNTSDMFTENFIKEIPCSDLIRIRKSLKSDTLRPISCWAFERFYSVYVEKFLEDEGLDGVIILQDPCSEDIHEFYLRKK